MNFINLIIDSYSVLLFAIGGLAVLLFGVGVYWIIQRDRTASSQAAMTQEMTAIAGDDVVATQLDLARAYLETGSGLLAKTILKAVLKQGSATQREEAKRLLGHV